SRIEYDDSICDFRFRKVSDGGVIRNIILGRVIEKDSLDSGRFVPCSIQSNIVINISLVASGFESIDVSNHFDIVVTFEFRDAGYEGLFGGCRTGTAVG